MRKAVEKACERKDVSVEFRVRNGRKSLERRDREELQLGESLTSFYHSKGFLKLLVPINLFYGEKI